MQIPYRKPGPYSLTPEDPHLTPERAAELEQKINHLKNNVRPKLAAEVAHMAEGGDFSENAGYQAIKAKLRGLNQKLFLLESDLRRAVIINPISNTDTVQLGHHVTIKSGDQEKTYQILGSKETNPTRGIISQHSPLGEKLLGCQINDEIFITINGQEKKYTVIKIAS